MDTLSDKWNELHERKADIHQDEYTPEELAQLLGISDDVIFHEIAIGDLKATRVGHKVICIARRDALDWLTRRGGV